MRFFAALFALSVAPTPASAAPWFGRSGGNVAPGQAPAATGTSATTNNSNNNKNNKIVTDFILVNAATETDILLMENDMVIDLGVVGTTQLTIRVETIASYNSFVKMDLNHGILRRVEPSPPYYLAGDEGGVIEVSHTIATLGAHILVACPNDSAVFGPPSPQTIVTAGGRRSLESDTFTNTNNECTSVRFTTVQGSATALAPPLQSEPSADELDAPPLVPTAPTDLPPPHADSYGIVNNSDNNNNNNNQLMQWHKVTVGFSGPPASETGMTIPGAYRAPSTFADYFLQCTFEHSESGTTLVVPGFYAGDGNAANQGSIGGSVWHCVVTPSRVGVWTWTALFTQGTNVAQNGGGNPGGFFDGASGRMQIVASRHQAIPSSATPKPRDFRATGRLSSNAQGFVHADGTPFVKVGPNSPSNLLNYADFDDADPAIAKSYAAHASDFAATVDPTFANGRGKNLVGALNYLTTRGVTSLTVTTLHQAGGVFPFWHSADNALQYDLSKIAQWGVVLDHADALGIAITIQLHHADDDMVLLNNGKLFEDRKLYYREMIARFGHLLGVTWDIGSDLTLAQIRERSEYIRTTDPYKSPIVVRTSSPTAIPEYATIATLDGVAVATTDSLDSIANAVTAWRQAGFLVTSAEQGPAAVGVPPDTETAIMNQVRSQALYGSLFSGAAGISYTFGSSFAESDETLQDFRSRAVLWGQSRVVLELLSDTVWTPNHDLVSSNVGVMCLSSASSLLVYQPAGSAAAATVTVTKLYKVAWVNPRTGGAPQTGSIARVAAGTNVSVGLPPSDPTLDWVIVLTNVN